MNIFVGVIVGLLVLMLLVTAHEFGHFIAARRNGVRVLEFGIGFPPRAMAWIKDPKTHKWRRLTRDEWDKTGVLETVINDKKQPAAETDEKIFADGLVFSLNYLPIGGFCQMDGESAEDERPGTFGRASFWAKTKILFAGVGMNWLVGFVILTILAWTGMPTFLSGQFTVADDTRTVGGSVLVAEVAEASPAKDAGFQVGDKIVAVDGNQVERPSDVTNYNSEHAGEEVSYVIEKDGEMVTVSVKLNESDAEYLLGVAMSSPQTLSYSTWSAPIVGAGLTLQITGETFKGVGVLIWNLFSGVGQMFSFDAGVRESGQAALSAAGESVSGPVGIIGVLFPSFTAAGPTNLAFLAALISISLACMNVLPIPALDGGRWLLIAIYKVRKKKLTREVEQKIVSRAMFALLALMAVVTIIDIVRFF